MHKRDMCGRYYTDRNMRAETEKLVHHLKWSTETKRTGDILPSRPAAVLRGGENGLVAEEMLWGFPRFEGNGLIINARAETALERRTFRESVRRRRCVIPARGFYEWNAVREKFSYERRGGAVLFMAGFYQMYQGRNRFVILTTEANASVRDVHDRMPLVLEPEELESWVLDDLAAEGILRRVPALLRVHADYEQMSLFE